LCRLLIQTLIYNRLTAVLVTRSPSANLAGLKVKHSSFQHSHSSNHHIVIINSNIMSL
jgi:hypothetical protein